MSEMSKKIVPYLGTLVHKVKKKFVFLNGQPFTPPPS